MNILSLVLAASSVGAVGTTLPNPNDTTYTADSAFGPNTLTVDPATGKAFLDIPIFKGYSYNQMEVELATNPLLAGFQRGMDHDFLNLLNSAGWRGWNGNPASEDNWYDHDGVVRPDGWIQHTIDPIDQLMQKLGHTLSNDPQLLNRFFIHCVDPITGRHGRMFLSDVADHDLDAYDPSVWSDPTWLQRYTAPDGDVLDFAEIYWDLGDDVQSLQTGHLLYIQLFEVPPTIPEQGAWVVWVGLMVAVGMAVDVIHRS